MTTTPFQLMNKVFLQGASQKQVPAVGFPADEFMHDYPVEWWYFIGHLQTLGGGPPERFAIEMTAARMRPIGMPFFDTCYLSVIDLQKKEYLSADRQSADGYRQKTAPSSFALEFPATVGQPGTWSIQGWAPSTASSWRYRLEAAFQAEGRTRAVRLDMTDKLAKPVLLHGTNGVQKFFGLDVGYYSRTRLAISGAMKLDSRHVLVEGDGWMDHEYGNEDLPNTYWTFLALTLDSGEELCVYQVSRKDPPQLGPVHAYRVSSNKTEVATTASLTPYGTPWGPWGYPLRQTVKATFPSSTYTFNVEAEFDDQRRVPSGETALPLITFYEGAAKVLHSGTGYRIGRGFLELAGYE